MNNFHEPRFATPEVWCALSGMSRRATFYALNSGDLKGVKIGPRIVLIDVQAGYRWIESHPPARLETEAA